MAEQGEQDKGTLDALLAKMPRIAEAVSAFPEAVQQQAFDALMAAASGGPTTTASKDRDAGTGKTKTKTKRKTTKGSDAGDTKTRRRAGAPSAVRDLDLAPSGKTSLKDFAAEKQPTTQHDRNVVSVYYLAQTVGVPNVTLDHVFTCYKDMGWREPSSLANSLALTASRKRFLDTANLDDIKLTPPGRNHVLHDLPSKKKGA